MKTRPHYFSLQGRRQDLLREGSGFPAEAVWSRGAPCPPRMTLWGWTWVSAHSPGARCRRPKAGCRKQAHRGGEAEAPHPASPEGDTGHDGPPPAPGNGAFHGRALWTQDGGRDGRWETKEGEWRAARQAALALALYAP